MQSSFLHEFFMYVCLQATTTKWKHINRCGNNLTELITELQSLKENFFHCKKSLTKKSNVVARINRKRESVSCIIPLKMFNQLCKDEVNVYTYCILDNLSSCIHSK